MDLNRKIHFWGSAEGICFEYRPRVVIKTTKMAILCVYEISPSGNN